MLNFFWLKVRGNRPFALFRIGSCNRKPTSASLVQLYSIIWSEKQKPLGLQHFNSLLLKLSAIIWTSFIIHYKIVKFHSPKVLLYLMIWMWMEPPVYLETWPAAHEIKVPCKPLGKKLTHGGMRQGPDNQRWHLFEHSPAASQQLN